jgi:nucleotide-binding universal stress UspA family protein
MTELDVRPVVVAVADADHLEAALRFGAAEAATQSCGIRLVHAYHVLPTGPETALLESEDGERIARANLTEAVRQAEKVLGDRVPISSRLVRGPVVQSIVEASDDARLVVLQRRDLSRLHRVVTRSISSGVASHAEVPVAVVPDSWSRGGAPGHTVTVGIDVALRSREVLRQALVAAAARRATLRVLHSWWSPGFNDDIAFDRLASGDWRTETIGELETLLAEMRVEEQDVPVQVEVAHGRPADALVAASRHSDLVVVGRHDALIPVGSHLGPVARAVVRESQCPVLLVAPTHRHSIVRTTTTADRAAAPA